MQELQEKELAQIDQKTKAFAEETKDKRTKERDELFKGHQVEIQDVKKTETKRRLDEVGSKDVAIKELGDFYKNDEENLNRIHENTVGSYKKKSEENLNNMQFKFNEVTNNLRDKAAADSEKSHRENTDKIKELERGFEKDKNFLNRKVSDISRSNDVQKDMTGAKGDFGKDNENLSGFKSSLDKIKNDYYKKSEQARKSYKDEILDVKNRGLERETKSLADMSDYTTRQNANVTKERNDTIAFYKRQIDRDNQSYETTIDERKKFDEARFRDSLINFNKKVQDITEKNYETLGKVREEYTAKHKQELEEKETSYLKNMDLTKQNAAARMRDNNATMNERLKLKR
jgi:hypothetical protein